MKLYKLLLVLCIISATSFAQTSKKSWMIGGTGSYSSTHEGDIHNTILDISPRIGYFFANNFAGGLNVAVNFTTDDGDKSTTEIVSPFLRYYFLPLADNKVKFFLNANAFYGKEDEGLGLSTITGYGGSLGTNIFLNKHIAFETAVSYNSTHAKVESVKDNTLGFDIGMQIYLFKE